MKADALRDWFRGYKGSDNTVFLLGEIAAQLAEQTELTRQMVKLQEDTIKIGQLRAYGQ